jgi:hypothetical protein
MSPIKLLFRQADIGWFHHVARYTLSCLLQSQQSAKRIGGFIGLTSEQAEVTSWMFSGISFRNMNEKCLSPDELPFFITVILFAYNACEK